jgi:outer membrane lipoprotein-sorting protein
MKTSVIILMTALITLTGFKPFAQNAKEILKKADEVTYAPEDQQAKVKMIMVDKRGNEQVREAEYIQKGSEMRLFRFTSPASQKGVAFLSLPDDVMYIYMPAYGKEQRIASHVKNQSFAGTDFSYDDMESKTMSEEYDPKLISETEDSYVLELVPKPDLRSDYSKLIMTVRKDNFYFSKVEYYDRGGRKVKILENKGIEKVNGYWVAMDMLMTDLLKDHSTRMVTEELVVDSNIPEEEFSVRKLKQ